MPTTTRQLVLDLLSDGQARTGAQIAKEIHEKHGRSFASVQTTLSQDFASDPRVRRERLETEHGRPWRYSLATA